jgi:hypothetical protein
MRRLLGNLFTLVSAASLAAFFAAGAMGLRSDFVGNSVERSWSIVYWDPNVRRCVGREGAFHCDSVVGSLRVSWTMRDWDAQQVPIQHVGTVPKDVRRSTWRRIDYPLRVSYPDRPPPPNPHAVVCGVRGAWVSRQEVAGFKRDDPWGGGIRGRTVHWDAVVSYWLIVPLFAVFPLLWLYRRATRRRRIDRGRCATCGYDLRMTPDRCPECGAVPERAGVPRPAGKEAPGAARASRLP